MDQPGPVCTRYRRLRPLGTGGSACVWLVEDPRRPGSRLALKEALFIGEGYRDLRREYVLQRRLRHPGIVELFDFHEAVDAGGSSFTMEYIDGVTLQEALTDEGLDAFETLASEALSALGFLHERGLFHRDLNPANLIVRRMPRLDTRVALFDLGLAQERDAEKPYSGPVGVLPFIAPEIFEGAAVDRASDLYSLGAVLYNGIFGQPPYVVAPDSLTSTIDRIRKGDRDPPPRERPLAAPLLAWIDTLLDPDPAARPGDASEALAGLSEAAGHPLSAGRRSLRLARLASDPVPSRTAEFKALVGRLQREAGPLLVWVRGPGGFGKSRLLQSLKTEAIHREWTVAEGPEEWDPHWAGADLATRAERLRRRSQESPLLCLLDDAEAVDVDCLRLLDRLAREGGSAPVRIIAAVDPSAVMHPLLQRLLEETETVPSLAEVRLEALADEQVRTLVERCTGSEESSSARVRWLQRASGGSPASVAALLIDQSWQEADGGSSTPEAVPDVEQIRLKKVHPRTTDWLATLALLGNAVNEERLLRGFDMGAEDAFLASEEARTHGLASRHAGRWTSSTGLHAGLERRALQDRERALRVIELLRAASGDFAAQWRAAQLLEGLGDPIGARDAAARAAELAIEAGDPDDAARCLGYALQRAGRDRVQRHSLRRRQALALAACGRQMAAARAWSAAAQLASETSDVLAARLGQSRALVFAGRFRHAERIARSIESESPGAVDESVLATARLVRGMVLGRLGREGEAIELLLQALDQFAATNDILQRARTLQVLAACRSRLRDETAERDFEKSIELFDSLGRQEDALKSLIGLAVSHQRNGDLARAATLLTDVRRRAESCCSLDLVETSLSKLSGVALAEGRLDRAISLAAQSHDHARHLGDHNRALLADCRLAEALTACGQPARAAKRLRDGLADPGRRVEPDVLDFARLLLAQALIESPTAEDREIRGLLERCRNGFESRRRHEPLLETAVAELEWLGRNGSRREFLQLFQEFEQRQTTGDRPTDPELLARVELALARRSLDRGDTKGAVSHAERAVETVRGGGPSARLAEAHAVAAVAFTADGKDPEAEQQRSLGLEVLKTMTERIEDEGQRTSFVRRKQFSGLTPHPAETGADARHLQALYKMIRALNSETDPVSLLDSILDMAVRGVAAERGFILLRESDGEFHVHASQTIEQETMEDARQLSQKLVDRAGLGESVLALDTDSDRQIAAMRSVSLYGIRSLMCVPLRSRGSLIGTVYLDRRRGAALFDQSDVRFIEAFADHAALALENARERAALVDENRHLRSIAGRHARPDALIGESEPMQQVYEWIDKAAASDLAVLIHGESGTGKELVARALHSRGSRHEQIFISVNCAAIPEALLESELFGHVKGAFTGAERDRAGLFEQADGGTLFLDEVGDMSPAMQARLLRVLQEGEVRRVGAETTGKVDVRIIAATHRDMQVEVEQGRFREDLYYRLHVLQIELPPLRDRSGDVALLIDHLLERIGRDRGVERPVMDEMVRRLLITHRWPGNVRQLENTLQRLTLLAGSAPIRLEHLRSDPDFRQVAEVEAGSRNDKGEFSLARGERLELQRALAAARGNRVQAARLLGVSRATIYRKIKQLGL